MRVAIGIDPDTTNTAIAIVDIEPETPRLIAAYCVKQKGAKERKSTLAMCDMAMGMYERRDELFPHPHEIVAIAVEGQELYLDGEKRTKNPRSILWLAPISGLWLMLLRLVAPEALRLFPAPGAWKGQVPKQIHHMRIGKEMGWEMIKVGTKTAGYCAPGQGDNVLLLGTKINKGDWKHLMDAIGLALWAGRELKKIEDRKGAE